MSGGAAAPGAAQRLGRLAPRPVYVGYGAYDEDSRAGARSLAAALEQAHWPLRVAEHAFGHGAREAYIDEAFAFWAEQDGLASRAAPAPPGAYDEMPWSSSTATRRPPR